MKVYRVLAWLLWAAVPLTAVRYGEAWDSLPPTLIVRFDAGDLQRPVAYISRGRLLMMEIAAIVTVVSIASAISMFVPEDAPPDVVSWVGLGAFYGAVGLLLWCQDVLLQYELMGLPMRVRQSLSFVDPTVITVVVVVASCFIGWKLWTWMLSPNS